MIKSLSSSEEIELKTGANCRLKSPKLHNKNGCDRTAGSLSIKIPFSENGSKSPTENDYEVLCQSSPSSEVSFGWEEITETTNLISRHSSNGIESRNLTLNESSNYYEKWKATFEDSDSVSSTEHKVERIVCCSAVKAVSKGESNLREGKELEAHSKHMTIRPAVSEKLVRDICRMKTAHHMSGSEDSESDGTCHSRRESVNSQELVLESPSSVKLEDRSCIKKKIHDVSRREKSGSDSTDDFMEMPSLLSREEYGLVTTGTTSELENLTEDEEIWMIQCPVSINPKDLQNKELVFGGKSDFTLELGDEKYETVCYPDRNKPVPCLLPSEKKGTFKAKMLQPEGLIVIMEKVEIPELKITLPKWCNFQIPNGLAVRHPLFGRDYEKEVTVQKGLTSQCSIMIHEDLRMQPKRLKKKKEKDRSVSVGYISESTGSCNERQAWQTSDGQPDSHHKSKKKKKNKEKHYDAEDCKRKGKLDEGIFEGFELLDTEGRQKGIQPNRRKKKKKDRSAGLGYISEDTGTCNERQAWQTSDGAQPDGHHKSKKKKKNKETHYDAEDCKRKRKLDENVFEGSELLDNKRRKKDKHEKMH